LSHLISNMKITTFVQHDFVNPDDLSGQAAVVIDTFRATTTMTTALQNGAACMIPVMHVKDALAIKAQDSDVLLGGERRTQKIDGFDFGNSPLEYTAQAVGGRRVVMSTTNGTKAVMAAKKAATIMLGCLNNASAVAEKLAKLQLDVTLLCAGTVGRLSMEDLLTAGMIIAHLQQICDVTLCDTSITARDMYIMHQSDINGVLKNTAHYNTMLKNDLAGDIAFCMQTDICSTVPVFDGTGFVKK